MDRRSVLYGREHSLAGAVTFTLSFVTGFTPLIIELKAFPKAKAEGADDAAAIAGC